MTTSLSRRLLVLAPLALALAACGNDAPPPAADVPAETPVAETAPVDTLAPSGTVLDEAIAETDIATRLTLVGAPTYAAADDMLEFEVEVFNDGHAPLVSEGSKPVQVGITLAGPDGVDAAPGLRDFQRAKLPLTVADSSNRVRVRVPAEPVLGLTVQAELVQETVAWFSKAYDEPVLAIGTFARCADGTGLCDGAGVPLAAR